MSKESILFNSKKESLALHFDMHHGHKNLEKAIRFLDKEINLVKKIWSEKKNYTGQDYHNLEPLVSKFEK